MKDSCQTKANASKLEAFETSLDFDRQEACRDPL
jgi:hypothetical protein